MPRNYPSDETKAPYRPPPPHPPPKYTPTLTYLNKMRVWIFYPNYILLACFI